MLDSILLSIILVILVATLGILYYMLKYNSNFLKQIQSLKGVQFDTLNVGEEAPMFRVMDEGGKRFVSKKEFYDKNTLLLFMNTKCHTCKAIIDKLDIIVKNYDLNIVAINNDEVFDDSEVKKALPDSVKYIRASHISMSYYVYVTPTVVLIEKGKIKMTNKVSNFNSLLNMLITEKNKLVS
ncbi:thioredoxin family protein [Bacillus spongiae]|uniref:Thioredoxin family protein n=1 Tax=Bacillus spongiae TaxID=2683610 RepID=A0ABU8HEQ1_9BACI